MEYNGLKYEIRDNRIVITGYTDIPEDGHIVIPEKIDGKPVTKLGEKAFFGCTSLTSVDMPFLEEVGRLAFKDCTSLTSVDMPNVTVLWFGVFDGCTSLTGANMPNVDTISMGAFSMCTSLASVSMPIVRNIGSNAFSGCKSLTEFILGENEDFSSEGEVLYDRDKTMLIAFPAAKGHVTVPDCVEWISSYAFENCTALTKISMPGATRIGRRSFFQCKSLESVSMPNIESINRNAFAGCLSLTEFILDENELFLAEGGALYNRDKTELVAFPAAKGRVTVPSSVKKINDCAFEQCAELTSVSMPNVTDIGDCAFSCCTSLESAEMPCVTKIGALAFSECNSLLSVRLGFTAPPPAHPEDSPLAIQVLFSDGSRKTEMPFEGCSPSLVVHVPKGAQGYDSPEWEGRHIVEDE